MKTYKSLIKPFDLNGINENCIVSFKPIDIEEWYTGYIKWIFPPKSKYNTQDYWVFKIDVILPVQPQWSEDNDKTSYYENEVDEIVILSNSK